MKISKYVVFVFWVVFVSDAFGQKNDVSRIKFSFEHSRRIPDHFVYIDIQRKTNNAEMKVEEIPSDTLSAQWKETKRTYRITLSKFDRLVEAVRKIDGNETAGQLGFAGKDGESCSIEMGNLNNKVTYKFWSPGFNTEQRHLQPFLEACKAILSTAKLDPEKILD